MEGLLEIIDDPILNSTEDIADAFIKIYKLDPEEFSNRLLCMSHSYIVTQVYMLFDIISLIIESQKIPPECLTSVAATLCESENEKLMPRALKNFYDLVEKSSEPQQVIVNYIFIFLQYESDILKSAFQLFIDTVFLEEQCDESSEWQFIISPRNILGYLKRILEEYDIVTRETIIRSSESYSNLFKDVVDEFFNTRSITMVSSVGDDLLRIIILLGQYIFSLSARDEFKESFKLDSEFCKSIMNVIENMYNNNDFKTMELKGDVLDMLNTFFPDKEFDKEIQRIGATSAAARENIYIHEQNIHNDTIFTSAMKILRFLFEKQFVLPARISDTEGIHMRLKAEYVVTDEKAAQILDDFFYRLKHDVVLYECDDDMRCNLLDIFRGVWKFINQHDKYIEMKIRLYQEIVDMVETCSSGYAIRLLNVLSGFCGNLYVQFGMEDEIKARVYMHLNNAAAAITDQDERDKLIEQFAEHDFCSRPAVLKLFRENIARIFESLREEYGNILDDADFDLYFRKAIINYEQ